MWAYSAGGGLGFLDNLSFEVDGDSPSSITGWTVNSGTINVDMAVSNTAYGFNAPDLNFVYSTDSIGTSEIQSDVFTVTTALVEVYILGESSTATGVYIYGASDHILYGEINPSGMSWTLKSIEFGPLYGEDVYMVIKDTNNQRIAVDRIRFF